ncbi:MAG: hypothetical protein V2I54_11195 [Bacteroidales bacterium]|jgi:hypothetical protein|nr:hypothetical protein [Bacteroidales bacterium]
MNQKEIIKNLQSNKTDTVLAALKLIRSEGNKELLYEVIKLLHHTDNKNVEEEIFNLLDHLKDQKSAVVIIEAIEDKKYNHVLPRLVSSCWKNGLHYEDHIETFINLFIEGDFQVAFEAYTVIDNMINIKNQDAERCLIKLSHSLEAISKDKLLLFNDINRQIGDKKENPA